MKLKRKSLLLRIFLSFLVIIGLLSTFNVMLFSFFQQNLREEIIRSNQLLLDKGAERYNAHFERLKAVLFQTYYDQSIIKFNKQLVPSNRESINYLFVVDIVRKLKETANNPFFYMENLLVLYRSDLFMVDKEGSSSKMGLDGVVYFNPPYTASYWDAQFESVNNYRLHPVQNYPKEHAVLDMKRIIPFSLKLQGSNYELIAMLDADKMDQAFLGNVPFLIQTDQGETLYNSLSASSIGEFPAFTQGESWKLYQNQYFFQHVDPQNGLRYTMAVPYSNIANQISKLQVTQTVILLLSIAVALAVSYGLSRRLHSPVKRIIASLKLPYEHHPRMETAIEEFDTISNHIGKLIEERSQVHYELRNSKSLLTNYSYIARLKSLHTGISEWQDFLQSEGPFFLILYQLNNRSLVAIDDGIKRWIREYAEIVLSEHGHRAYTFQIENNQIISVVFRQDGPEAVKDALEQLKHTLDRDRQTCLVHLVVSPLFDHSSKLHQAYEQVSAMLLQACLLDETQIITKHDDSVSSMFAFPADQEQNLLAHIVAGNDKGSLHAIQSMLDCMEKKQATLAQFRQLAFSFGSRMVKAMEHSGVEASFLMEAEIALKRFTICYTAQQFRSCCEDFIRFCVAQIRAKKEIKDDVIGFVLKTMETRYSEELSLDQIADQLHLSSAYLSVYIKEKTGANYIEHMNRIRIRKARELLTDSELSVRMIGQQIGYRNVTSFIRMFKKLTGETPGEFRRYQAFSCSNN
ncbi:helix-turn-helix transcriptional regulator [Paenibacillus foliorum]|nr:helix-turn-helix domain-containing protein [Paenibacillus foliorum]